MACTVELGQLHCTVSECSFGPQCEDDTEAYTLLDHVRRTRGVDPRIVAADDLRRALDEVRSGAAGTMPTHPNMLCACGSGERYGRLWWTQRKTYTACGQCDGTETNIPRGIEARP